VSDQPHKSMPNPSSAGIIFAGSPGFAIPSLRGLVESGHAVLGVLTQPDRPAGRGRKLRPSPVKAYAIQHGFEILQPDSLGATTIQQRLREMQPDLMVIVAYGLLLPASVLEIPRAGCINVHASLLPRWRGASPIQAAILAGDQSTGISIMRMEEGLDTGPVYATREVPIGASETAGQLEGRLAEGGARLLIETLPGILDESATTESQCDDEATYAGRINKADALIDWAMSAVEIDRRIRAYNPWPVAYTTLDGLRMRCWAAAPAAVSVDTGDVSSGTEHGKVLAVSDAGIEVQTGDGVLRIAELQMPGKQKMRAKDFANGYRVLTKCLGRPG
jgi:methionyl-tRNA formyltransferase